MSLRKLAVSLLVLAVIGGALALKRQSEAFDHLSHAEVTTQESNSLDYDPVTGVFTVTGPDPYIYLDLPKHSIPLLELRLDFKGPAQSGGWYIYPCPAHLAQPIINQDWVVTAVPHERGEDHSLVWTLDNSQLARIDFPDELSVPLTLEQIVLTTKYASSSSSVFVAMVATAALAILLLLVGGLGPRLHHPVGQIVLMLILVAIKTLLASEIGQSFMMQMAHDDRLFMTQGESIAEGNWLGPYNELTHAKGPVFPMFLALSALSGISLQFNVALLHALGCLLFIWAISPWLKHAGWRIALFALLLFDPQSLSAEILGRLLRSMVQPALTLFTLAGFIGMVCRAHRSIWCVLPWGLWGGLAAGAFSYSREEGIWLLPSAILLAATAIWIALGQTQRNRGWIVLIAMAPLFTYVSSRAAVRAVNQAHYGISVGVDGNETSFADAHGAILRVENPHPLPGAPSSTAARALTYRESPAFAELADVFENRMMPKWRNAGWEWYETHERSGEEIRNGWFAWALREAAAIEGFYETPGKADAYWRQVADEINAAVDEGRLPGGSERSGFFPPWHSSYLKPTLIGWFRAIDLMVRSTDFLPHSIVSVGTEEELTEMAEFYHVTATKEISPHSWDGQTRHFIARIIGGLGWPLTAFALFCTGFIAKRSRGTPHARERLAVLLSLWGGATALALIVSLVEATSFPAVIGAYLAPAVPLIIACWVLAPAWAWNLRSSAESRA